MDEASWLASTDPTAMLTFLRTGGQATPRKLRLFGCACCRRIWHLLEERAKAGVSSIEQFTDGLLGQQEFESAGRWVGNELTSQVLAMRGGVVICATTAVVRFFIPDITEVPDLLMGTVADGAWFASSAAGVGNANQPDALEQQAQAKLLRDIFGTPFRPLPPINLSLLTWNGGLIRTLAQAAYDDRLLPSGQLDPARLGVLADALTDAGCTDAELLEHLRGEGPHLRGCYAVDCILGKS